jgi:adenylate kinase family enzyme
VTREDDRESVIRQRLAEYETQTRPLLDFFRQEGVPVFEIGGASKMPEQISKEICDALRGAGVARSGVEAPASVGSDAGVGK